MAPTFSRKRYNYQPYIFLELSTSISMGKFLRLQNLTILKSQCDTFLFLNYHTGKAASFFDNQLVACSAPEVLHNGRHDPGSEAKPVKLIINSVFGNSEG